MTFHRGARLYWLALFVTASLLGSGPASAQEPVSTPALSAPLERDAGPELTFAVLGSAQLGPDWISDYYLSFRDDSEGETFTAFGAGLGLDVAVGETFGFDLRAIVSIAPPVKVLGVLGLIDFHALARWRVEVFALGVGMKTTMFVGDFLFGSFDFQFGPALELGLRFDGFEITLVPSYGFGFHRELVRVQLLGGVRF